MDATHVHEEFVNATEGHSFGENTMPISETIFENMTPGEVFRWLRQEYGRCQSRVYVDGPNGPIHVGWTFLSRQRYEDTNEPYLREVWVTFTREVEPARPARREAVAVSTATP